MPDLNFETPAHFYGVPSASYQPPGPNFELPFEFDSQREYRVKAMVATRVAGLLAEKRTQEEQALAERVRLEKEKAAAEAEVQAAQREREQKIRAEKERLERERLEREREKKERAEKERLEKEKADEMRAMEEREMVERLAREEVARQFQEKENQRQSQLEKDILDERAMLANKEMDLAYEWERLVTPPMYNDNVSVEDYYGEQEGTSMAPPITPAAVTHSELENVGDNQPKVMPKLTIEDMSNMAGENYESPKQQTTPSPFLYDITEVLEPYTCNNRSMTPGGKYMPWSPTKEVGEVLKFIRTYTLFRGARNRGQLNDEKGQKENAVVVDGAHLMIHEMRDIFKTRGHVTSVLMRLVTKLYNKKWKGERYMFCPDLMAPACLHDDRGNDVGFNTTQRGFQHAFFCLVQHIKRVDPRICKVYLFPICYKRHWFCYVFDAGVQQVGILDSTNSPVSNFHIPIKREMTCMFTALLNCVEDGLGSKVLGWRVSTTNIPEQVDTFSCGMLMLVGAFLWNGGIPCTSKAESYFSSAREVLMTLLCFDEDNEARSNFLRIATAGRTSMVDKKVKRKADRSK